MKINIDRKYISEGFLIRKVDEIKTAITEMGFNVSLFDQTQKNAIEELEGAMKRLKDAQSGKSNFPISDLEDDVKQANYNVFKNEKMVKQQEHNIAWYKGQVDYLEAMLDSDEDITVECELD